MTENLYIGTGVILAFIFLSVTVFHLGQQARKYGWMEIKERKWLDLVATFAIEICAGLFITLAWPAIILIVPFMLGWKYASKHSKNN